MMKNAATGLTAQLDREALIARNEALQELAALHFFAAFQFMSSARLREHVLQISRWNLEGWDEGNEEGLLVFELAGWTAAKGRSTALQRYARQRSAPMQPEEAAVLASMQMSVISFWKVQEAHPVVGWIVRDVLHGGTLWIIAETLSCYFDAGERPTFVTRLFRDVQEGFWMTCGSNFLIPEGVVTFSSTGKDWFHTGSEQHAAYSRESRYVSALYAVIPERTGSPSNFMTEKRVSRCLFPASGGSD